MRRDVSTPAGRARLDGDVARVLPDAWSTRGDVAALVEMDGSLNELRLVGASLGRGVRDGWAESSGSGAWTRYRRRR